MQVKYGITKREAEEKYVGKRICDRMCFMGIPIWSPCEGAGSIEQQKKCAMCGLEMKQ